VRLEAYPSRDLLVSVSPTPVCRTRASSPVLQEIGHPQKIATQKACFERSADHEQ
jgi:hypothetical protein